MPGVFSTRGHPAALEAVRRMIQRGTPPHALLISGPAGTGKTTLGLDLAAGLLCLDPDPQARPCRACVACRKVDHGTHPDLHVVVAEGAGEQIRLPQVQALIAELALLPMEGRTRVALIPGAHRMNPDAQNALLKTLEEPSGAASIVLCADDLATLLPTVISRAARLRLGPVPRQAIADLLVDQGLADPATATLLAGSADGRAGTAMVLARDPDALLWRASLARQLIDLLRADRRTRLGSIGQLLADAAPRDVQASSAAPDPEPNRRAPTGRGTPASRRPLPAERRRAAQQVLAAWREVGRDLLVVAEGGRSELKMLELLEDLAQVAPGIDRSALVRFLDRLDGLAAAIEAYANPELALDDLVLAWPRGDGAAAPPITAAQPAARPAA
jgi:DNA polymerase-3 subunit delta'